ncbi:MAG: 7-cyano-7-deazaguanine synthase QueC [Thermoplasmatota archaeon]
MRKKAVVLLSGGIDSSTTMAIARSEGYSLYALTLLYGQIHSREVEAARDIASSLGAAEHKIIELPNGTFSGSALTGQKEIPLNRDPNDMSAIPDTYVPARNLVFLSIALGYAEAMGADAVFIGATSVDYSGYPDCRPEFIESFRKTSGLATKRGVEGNSIEICAPLLQMSKDEIITKGNELGVDYSLTWSCYSGGKLACGRCDSCIYRLRGFEKAGSMDPIEYEGGNR